MPRTRTIKKSTGAPKRAGATSRLEARIPSPVYEAMEIAAELRGLTLTAYVTAIMGENARQTIEETDVIRLACADQIAFAQALTDAPASPTGRMLTARRRHAALIQKR